MEYAILNAEGHCINRIVWDGTSGWQPPEGFTAVPDPNSLHRIYVEPQPEPAGDPLSTLTDEQRAALVALLQP